MTKYSSGVRVTVVTPTLNQGRYIRETIDSVLSQDHPDLEYIVMDGGSTDNTIDILKSYGSRLTWESGKDSGQAEAINRGFARSTGAILTWLNSDDTLLPGAISSAVSYFERNGDLGLLYGNAIFTGPDGGYLYTTSVPRFSVVTMIEECRNPICQPASFFSRGAWLDCGLLNTGFHYFFDWDLWIRMGLSVSVLAIRDILATYRLHPQSKTGKGAYPTYELEAIYGTLGSDLRTRRALANMHRRIAEYQDANGQHFRAWLSRRKAWMKG